MKKKGQVVRLKNRETSMIVEAKVIQYDSIQGYWLKAISSNDSDWTWYHTDKWEEIK